MLKHVILRPYIPIRRSPDREIRPPNYMLLHNRLFGHLSSRSYTIRHLPKPFLRQILFPILRPDSYIRNLFTQVFVILFPVKFRIGVYLLKTLYKPVLWSFGNSLHIPARIYRGGEVFLPLFFSSLGMYVF